MSSTPQSIIPFRSRADRTDRDSTGRPGGSDTVLDGIPDQLDQLADTIDRAVHANLARQTGGLSPAALAGAYADWAVHLASSPGKQAQLLGKALRKGWRFANHMKTARLPKNIAASRGAVSHVGPRILQSYGSA